MQDYQSSLGDTKSRKFETFSYLSKFNAKQIRVQIQYIVDKGWNPSVEHTEPEHAIGSYWYMWKLPMFGETNIDVIINELKACHVAHPKNHVRLLGLDNFAQCAGASMVIYHGETV